MRLLHSISPATPEPGYYEDPDDLFLDRIWEGVGARRDDPDEIRKAILANPDLLAWAAEKLRRDQAHEHSARRLMMNWFARDEFKEVAYYMSPREITHYGRVLEENLKKGNY